MAVYYLILFGTWFVSLFFIFRRYMKTYASRDWPETIGTILEGSISQSADSNDDNVYHAIFKFTYEVPGSELQGSFQIRHLLSSEGFADALAEHPAGTGLLVRYNPKKPAEYITEFNQSPHLPWGAIFIDLTIRVLLIIAGLS